MKRLSVPAFPCCPVSTQPFRDLLLMWKLAQPQCSFILDFCFVNTSYVVGDMTWTSYLSPSPSRNYTGSLISFQSGYNIVPKAQCLFFSYCRWELASESKIEGDCSPISPLHHLPSESMVAVQSCAATLGGYWEHQVLRNLCLYSTWVSHNEKALQEPSPEVLVLVFCREMCLCPVTHLRSSLRLLIFLSGGNAEMAAMEQGHSISGSVSACLSGSTWLHCTVLNMCDCLGLRGGSRSAGTLAMNFQCSCELFP